MAGRGRSRKVRGEEWREVYGNSEANVCYFAAPCGGKCCLDPEVDHAIHSCHKSSCQHCHGRERFQRTRIA